MCMRRCMLRLVVTAVMSISFTAAAVAVCGAPSQSGLALCFPSAASTVLYPATIEMGINSGGVPITHLDVYDGNVRVESLGFVPGQLVDFSLLNGFHKVTVNAWDADGKFYEAKSSFTITGFGAGTCALPNGSINLCWPAAGSYQPESTTISAAFAEGVKSWSMTLDGKALINSADAGGSASGPLVTDVFAAAGGHKLVVQAVSANGMASTVARQFSTFYDLNCNPKSGTCTPGISIVKPSNISEDTAGDEGAKFELQAEVAGNPKPTTKMIVYLDGVNVEQSAGPGITANVGTTKGSHYVVIQAWDTAGKLYETYGNVNVQ